METSDWISFGAAIFSLIAIIVAGVALWKTHFVKFSPILSVGTCRLRIYPIKNGDKRWFISSFDIPLSFTNQGAQAGKIEDIRIKVTFPNLPINGHYEMFYPKWDVNGNELSKERFTWIDKSVKENWMPFIILPKETKNKHLVFESRWEEPVIQDLVECQLEIKCDNKKDWIQITKWKLKISKKVWYEMAEKGVSFGTSPDDEKKERDFINPKDLHKYTGTKEPIEDERKDSSPSYLDYKEKE